MFVPVAEVNLTKNGLVAIGQLCSTNDVEQNFKVSTPHAHNKK